MRDHGSVKRPTEFTCRLVRPVLHARHVVDPTAGQESGYLVATMPPDSPRPMGGLAIPGLGKDGFRLGDTVGRTPGAYGFIVSCNSIGYLGPRDVINDAQLMLTVSGIKGINPLSSRWTSDAGSGPARLQTDMVGHSHSSCTLLLASSCVSQHVRDGHT